jgi:hypothetical protein
MSGGELEVLGGFSWERFARVWTAKEAVLKLAGVGLLELDRCRVVGVRGVDEVIVEHRGRGWIVRQSVRDGHVAAVVWDGDEAERDVEWMWTKEHKGAEEQRQPVPRQRRGCGRREQRRSTGVVRAGRLERVSLARSRSHGEGVAAGSTSGMGPIGARREQWWIAVVIVVIDRDGSCAWGKC